MNPYICMVCVTDDIEEGNTQRNAVLSNATKLGLKECAHKMLEPWPSLEPLRI